MTSLPPVMTQSNLLAQSIKPNGEPSNASVFALFILMFQ
jgi:hypothetical protein